MEDLVQAEERKGAAEQPAKQLYNLVLASEVLEHVNEPDAFCR